MFGPPVVFLQGVGAVCKKDFLRFIDVFRGLFTAAPGLQGKAGAAYAPRRAVQLAACKTLEKSRIDVNVAAHTLRR